MLEVWAILSNSLSQGHVPGAGIMSQGQAFAPPFAGQQLPFGGGYQQYQGVRFGMRDTLM